MILSYFDINCYNLLLRHYCSKQDWPNAIQLFQALLDSTDAVKPKANYVSLIMIHELARALGHAEDLKIPDESLMALKLDSVSAADSWMASLYELRLWNLLESWISRCKSNRPQQKIFPVRFGPLGGEAALRRLSKFSNVDQMLRFTEVLSRDRSLSAAELSVVAKELQKRNHADAGYWTERAKEAGLTSSKLEPDLASVAWQIDKLSDVARALFTQRGHIPMDRFDRLISRVFFTKASDSQIERDKAVLLVEDTLDVWRQDRSTSLYATLVRLSNNRGVAVSDYVLLRMVKHLVDMPDLPVALAFLAKVMLSYIPSTPETRQLMYKLVLLCPAPKTIEQVKRLEFLARSDEATLFEPSLITVFMKAYRIFPQGEGERLWQEMTIKRKMMPSVQMLYASTPCEPFIAGTQRLQLHLAIGGCSYLSLARFNTFP
jgi:hypothetical protein